MQNLSRIYKNLIISGLVLSALTIPCLFCSAEEYSDDLNEMDSIEESAYDSSTAYINDIEILGSNIIKSDYILSKMSLKKGDLY